MAGALMAIQSEIMDPLIEAATGMKTRLEQEGWSPTAAEQMAIVYFQSCLMVMTK